MRVIFLGFLRFYESFRSPAPYHSVLGKDKLLPAGKRLAGIKSDYQITAEGSKICFYTRSKLGVESISTDTPPQHHLVVRSGFQATFASIPIKEAKIQLKTELFFYRLALLACLNEDDRDYLKESAKTAQRALLSINEAQIHETSYLNHEMEGRLQYVANKRAKELIFAPKDSIVVSSLSEIEQSNYSTSEQRITEKSRPQSKKSGEDNLPTKVIVFYLDNVSARTANLLAKDAKTFPNLSKLLSTKQHEEPVCSVSNWTSPASISLLGGCRYENHKIYDHATKPYWKINKTLWQNHTSFIASNKSFTSYFQQRFICGTNWRMSPEHGVHSFFNHALSNPIRSDGYITSAQAIKQLDIAGINPSFHWISLMDSHHPVEGSVLPFGSLGNLNDTILSQGYSYQTGPKSSESRSGSAMQIYFSQLESIDRMIGSILDHSLKYTPLERHVIALVSDHGTDFLHQDSLYEKYCEKHLILQHIWRPGRVPHSPPEYKLPTCFLLNSLVIATGLNSSEIIHANEDLIDANYSQIAFANKPYEFIYFMGESIYTYTSRDCVGQTTADGKNRRHASAIGKGALPVHLFRFGTWKRIPKNGDPKALESTREIPNEVLSTFNKVSRSWLGY